MEEDLDWCRWRYQYLIWAVRLIDNLKREVGKLEVDLAERDAIQAAREQSLADQISALEKSRDEEKRRADAAQSKVIALRFAQTAADHKIWLFDQRLMSLEREKLAEQIRADVAERESTKLARQVDFLKKEADAHRPLIAPGQPSFAQRSAEVVVESHDSNTVRLANQQSNPGCGCKVDGGGVLRPGQKACAIRDVVGQVGNYLNVGVGEQFVVSTFPEGGYYGVQRCSDCALGWVPVEVLCGSESPTCDSNGAVDRGSASGSTPLASAYENVHPGLRPVCPILRDMHGVDTRSFSSEHAR